MLDLVRDRAPQVRDKRLQDGLPMDSLDEIFVIKICALVGRSEVRDLGDLRALEEKGYRVEDFLELAQRKDGGATAATLAWLLSSLPVPTELGDYRAELEARMLRHALHEAEG